MTTEPTTIRRAKRLLEDLRHAPPETIHDANGKRTCVQGALDLHAVGLMTEAELTHTIDRAERWLVQVYRDKWGFDVEAVRALLGRGRPEHNDRRETAW